MKTGMADIFFRQSFYQCVKTNKFQIDREEIMNYYTMNSQ